MDPPVDQALVSRVAQLDHATEALAGAPEFSKTTKVKRVLDALHRVLLQRGGCAAVRERAAALDEAGLFTGTDWAHPDILVPGFVGPSLRSGVIDTVVLEATSELRLVAIAAGEYTHPAVSAEDAKHFLSQVLAMNLEVLFSAPSEAERVKLGRVAHLIRDLFGYVADQIGYDSVLDKLGDEIWRVLRQRPIQVDHIKAMVTRIAVYREDPEVDLGASGQGLDRLISALFGPTEACREDPGVDVYRSRLDAMDAEGLEFEARGFARAMHDTGLVSPYHATLVRFLIEHNTYLLGEALGVSETGRTCLQRYPELVHCLIVEAVHPDAAQCLYGIALMLDRGILHQPPIVPSLWRQLALRLEPGVRQRLVDVFGPTPEPESRLLGGLLSMLGQPLGVGQGDNPTCQSARALSMWAYNDPDYLLQMVVWAARDDEIVMHFEGQPLSSKDSSGGVATTAPLDLDPVSQLLVPHLDRIYAEMIRRCADRPGDPHKWVNPEFHGWWSARGFNIDVDVATGNLIDLDDFVRQFYASYHLEYNGGQPLVHPQPAGVAVTDSAARYIGWHAITILRVAPDPDAVMRVYFFNPNNDSGQDWGDGVVVGTAGNGEKAGEGSLPFEQFASRLYIFHTDPLENGEPDKVPASAVQDTIGYIERSWGADRMPGTES
ncbi:MULTISPECIES: hypothetical protein [Nocardiaceae]|uniref:hypothetical protein n=1 Tax=Nocardiaceae TaxID=85025 RepID=UPI0003748F82|nr:MULTISPECIES: hypothetical protein [Rhodococcus]OZC54664.1 hypothetical protein CH267_15380 [Rhodococcus sp. 06-621-2]OZC81623.1 hypothetical protein CH282_16970 [Rhodococcus sp. 06-418-1B]OZD14758.1 hypothetical protein CH280_10695 [Rhodococcus sp. 06-156-4C]OZD20166.1 hypothetical protein CH248_16140 [Rhodococcus sp. 06-156-4a]OZD22530.1 hypothetical protein CH253_09065 [Rhodococcus sp. 06-156-3C]